MALNILLALADEERHGYGIGVEVRERTGGKMRLGPGTLYGSLKRMVDGGLVEDVEESERRQEEQPDGTPRRYDAERRRYYRVTGFGERVLEAELARLARLHRRLGLSERTIDAPDAAAPSPYEATPPARRR